MKEIPKIHEGEYRFCLILWENEPISAARLQSSASRNLDGSEQRVIQC